MSESGTDIPVAATFAGVSFMPWWYAVAINNARPRFVVTPTGVHCRVIRRRDYRFIEITSVDLRTTWRTMNIILRFHDRWLTFMANVETEDRARLALAALSPVGTVFTPRARALVDR